MQSVFSTQYFQNLRKQNCISSEDEYFITDFQKEIYKDTFNSENIKLFDRFKFLSEYIYKTDVSELGKYYKNLLYDFLCNKNIIFGGRILSNLGIEKLKNIKPFNCYATQRNLKPVDSLDCIFEDLKIAAQILKTEGGVGFNFSHLRPRSTFIKGIGITSPGVVSFMEIFDKMSTTVTKGGSSNNIRQYDSNKYVSKKKIRKGAMISILECWHPDIKEYIEAKKVPNFLTKFNISVGITNDFMDKLQKNEYYELIFPDINFEKYDDEWDGDIEKWKSKNYPIIIYEKILAKDLWSLIIDNMYSRNEPGLYFIDNANEYNNISYYQRISGVNPCGEISMMGDPGIVNINGIEYKHSADICNLGSINLASFVLYDKNKDEVYFDFELFKDSVKCLVRTLDNIIDIDDVYINDEIKNSAKLRRKIGCGNIGYASCLYMLGLKYGSDEANEFSEKIQNLYAITAYETSLELAKEKGKFLLCDNDKIINNGFIKNSGIFTDEFKNEIKKYGLRNSSLLTTAPTGNTSSFIYVSGGIEPVFSLTTIRWVSLNYKFDEVCEQESIYAPNIYNNEWFETKDFKFSKRGDEEILISNDGRFMIDKNRGLCKNVEILEYGYYWCKKNLSEEKFKQYNDKDVFVTCNDLTVKDHLEPFKIFSKYIDNSISKTINLKKDYSKDEFSDLFIDIYRNKCRGVTTYRDGTMTAVLEAKKENIKNEKIVKEQQNYFYDVWEKHSDNIVFENVKLPTVYNMKGFEIKSEGKKWRLHVAFKDRNETKPFAIFVQTNNYESNVLTYNVIEKLEELAISENIPQIFVEQNRKKYMSQSNVDKIARVLGLLLRHNVDIVKIVKTMDNLENVNVSSFVYRIKKFLYGFIKNMENGKKCPVCGSNLLLKEGCETCDVCNYSKC